MDAEETRLLAIEYLRREKPGQITVKEHDLPSPGAYGFDPEGWVTFCVIDEAVCKVGGDEFIAVNLTTKEVRSLGIIGD